MNLKRFEHVLKRDFDILYDYIIREGGVESFFRSLNRETSDEEGNLHQFNDAYIMIMTLETMRDNKERLEFALL